MTEDVSTALAKAEHFAAVERYDEARSEIARHLAGSPDSVHGLCLLARCELELEDYSGAVRASERALAVDPVSEWALRLRALALIKQSRHGAARDSAEAAVRAGPNTWANHYTLAHVLLQLNDARTERVLEKQAYESARRAVELAPHESAAHVMAGLAAGALGRKNIERESYEEALRLDPRNATALNNLAAMDINQARLGAGARNVIAGLRLDPGEEMLRQNLDAVALRLMARLLNVMLLSGFLLLFASGRSDGNYAVRAAAGGVLLGGYALVAWLTLRHLPRGARLHLKGLPRRMTTAQRWLAVALVVFTVAIVVAAFAPGQLWFAGTATMGVVIRIFQVLMVIWVIRWIVNRVRSAGTR